MKVYIVLQEKMEVTEPKDRASTTVLLTTTNLELAKELIKKNTEEFIDEYFDESSKEELMRDEYYEDGEGGWLNINSDGYEYITKTDINILWMQTMELV